MSAHPAYDPDPQADVPAETSVRRLIDDLIRTAAPRLGKVAVARIAVPLTDAVIALRAEVLAEAEARVAAAEIDPAEVGDVISGTRAEKLPHDSRIVRCTLRGLPLTGEPVVRIVSGVAAHLGPDDAFVVLSRGGAS